MEITSGFVWEVPIHIIEICLLICITVCTPVLEISVRLKRHDWPLLSSYQMVLYEIPVSEVASGTLKEKATHPSWAWYVTVQK